MWQNFTFLPKPELCEALPGLKQLTPREWAILAVKGITEESLPQVWQPSVIDLSQTLGRRGLKSASPDDIDGGRTGTFTPKGTWFHTGFCRTILGVEGLRLQNIWYSKHDAVALREFDNKLLLDLAGNAFAVNSVATTVLALMVLIAKVSTASETLFQQTFAEEESGQAPPPGPSSTSGAEPGPGPSTNLAGDAPPPGPSSASGAEPGPGPITNPAGGTRGVGPRAYQDLDQAACSSVGCVAVDLTDMWDTSSSD